MIVAEIAVFGLQQAQDSVIGPADIFGWAMLIPNLAVSFRRLHDIDRSAWWLLIAAVPLVGIIVVLFWQCPPGTIGKNDFGMDPIAP